MSLHFTRAQVIRVRNRFNRWNKTFVYKSNSLFLTCDVTVPRYCLTKFNTPWGLLKHLYVSFLSAYAAPILILHDQASFLGGFHAVKFLFLSPFPVVVWESSERVITKLACSSASPGWDGLSSGNVFFASWTCHCFIIGCMSIIDFRPGFSFIIIHWDWKWS